MAREAIENLRSLPPITIPPHGVHMQPNGILQGIPPSPLEFWIQTEATPLLVPPKKVYTAETLPEPSKEPSPSNITSTAENESSNSSSKDDNIPIQETTWTITCQVFLPFMIAGFGTVAAGLLLDEVQDWDAFQSVPEMFVLVPALLGLKGNLEMTLASRISTQANLGLIDGVKEQWKMTAGNLALLQCQSLVLGLVASALASAVGWVREKSFNPHNVLLLTSSSLVTASVASLLLGSLTIVVVICSRKLRINPDNVAAPLSASLGDVVTLALLALVASKQFAIAAHNDYYMWVEGTIVLGCLLLIPIWAIFAHGSIYTRQVLYSGWIPVISAVAISSGGGYILNFAVAAFKGIAACQPVINGVGGNLVAIQACRISTYLHQRSEPGSIPDETTDEENPKKLCVSPLVALLGKSAHAQTARILILIAIPGHLIFISSVHFLKSDYTPLTFEFLILYLTAALIQVSLLLYIAHCLILWMWKYRIDPDDAAIPYLTALGDLLGTALLYLAFITLDAF